MKSFTDIEQSKKLAEILPIESADMFYVYDRHLDKFYGDTPYVGYRVLNIDVDMPCWSLAALFDILKDKCGYFELVYLKRTSDGRANSLEDVYRFSTDVYDVYKTEVVDACVEMILKLKELKLL